MKKFLPFSKRQPSLDRFAINRGGWPGSDKFNGKSLRRISATSLNTKSIQVVRGAYNIDLNKVDSSFTKLHRACLLNDDSQVRKQIHKVDNNSHDSSNRYPIHLATVNGNSAIVKLLIENKANPNVQDNEGNTPLIKSIECGHEHLVKFLLNSDADPNLADLDGNTALHWAIMTESMIAIEALMGSKKCDLSLRNNKDETCLHLAARSAMISQHTIDAMLKDGASLDAKDQLGLTATDIAQACGNKTALNIFDKLVTIPLVCQEGGQKSVRKMCDEYRLKYLTKNRENLEYEKRLIQLNSQIERLKVDMSYLREHNEKLEAEKERILAENTQLVAENSRLLEQLKEEQRDLDNNQKDGPTTSSKMTNEAARSGCQNELADSAEARDHHEFLVTRAFLQDRINKLKLVSAEIN